MYDFGDGLVSLLKIMTIGLVIFVPLGVWKLIDLIF
jgi:hypothetical protein